MFNSGNLLANHILEDHNKDGICNIIFENEEKLVEKEDVPISDTETEDFNTEDCIKTENCDSFKNDDFDISDNIMDNHDTAGKI